MSLVAKTKGFIDPKDYPFKRFIDEQKHLDTDKERHKIKPIIHKIEDLKGEEHKYCDKSQLDAECNFRRPKKLKEAERRGFNSVMEMLEADKKADEDAKLKVVADQKAEIDDLKKQIADLRSSFTQYIQPVHPQ